MLLFLRNLLWIRYQAVFLRWTVVEKFPKKQKFQPHSGTWWKVSGLPKPIGFILWGPCTKFHGNPSNRTRGVDQPIDRPTEWHSLNNIIQIYLKVHHVTKTLMWKSLKYPYCGKQTLNRHHYKLIQWDKKNWGKAPESISAVWIDLDQCCSYEVTMEIHEESLWPRVKPTHTFISPHKYLCGETQGNELSAVQ